MVRWRCRVTMSRTHRAVRQQTQGERHGVQRQPARYAEVGDDRDARIVPSSSVAVVTMAKRKSTFRASTPHSAKRRRRR